MTTRGGRGRAASASASTRVARTRLSRSTRRRASVQRASATPAPARCTTASISPAPSSSTTPASGSHHASSGPRGARRTRRTTSCPCVVRNGAKARPIRPEDPLTSTRSRGAPACDTAKARSSRVTACRYANRAASLRRVNAPPASSPAAPPGSAYSIRSLSSQPPSGVSKNS